MSSWPPASCRARRRFPGIDHAKVASYLDLIEGRKAAGKTRGDHRRRRHRLRRRRVPDPRPRRHSARPSASTHEWGIDPQLRQHAAASSAPVHEAAPRQVWLLQRKASKVGDGLAKTTGWIRRTLLKKRGVQMIAGVDLRAHRRRRPAHQRQRPGAGAGGRYHRRLRRPGAAPRTAGAAAKPPASRTR